MISSIALAPSSGGADAGDADSQAALGFLYEQGLGVRTDIAQAISLYKSAARQGSSRFFEKPRKRG